MNLVIKNTFKLKKKEILGIAKLKNSNWKFGLKSQLGWINRKINNRRNDIHIMIKLKDRIIGYVHLGKRTYVINKKKKNYILFRTLIVSKKHRNKNYSNIIMQKVSNIINKKKIIGFLICKKKMVKFYEKFNWFSIGKKYIIHDHGTDMIGMIYYKRKIYYNKKISFNYNI